MFIGSAHNCLLSLMFVFVFGCVQIVKASCAIPYDAHQVLI